MCCHCVVCQAFICRTRICFAWKRKEESETPCRRNRSLTNHSPRTCMSEILSFGKAAPLVDLSAPFVDPRKSTPWRPHCSCCPDCSTKSKCKTIRCHCRKDHKLCSHCISKKCENKGDAKEEEGGGAELDDDEEAEEEEEEEKKGDQDVNSLSTMMNILHP